MATRKSLRILFPLATLFFLDTFQPGESAPPLLGRLGTKKRSANGIAGAVPSTSGNEAPTFQRISAASERVSSSPSNADLLMQYLEKKNSQPGKSSEEFIAKLINSKEAQAQRSNLIADIVIESEPVEQQLVELVNTESCIEVPFTRSYECFQRELEQTAYSCSLDYYPESCQIATKALETKCPVDRETLITYECPKLKNTQLCYQQPKMVDSTCYGYANQAQERDCTMRRSRRVCNTVEVDVPWTCLDNYDSVQTYSCDKLEAATECIPNVVAVEDDCTRETNVPVVYEYYDVEPKTVCEIVRTEHDCRSTLLVRSNQQPCTETYYDTVCTMVDVPFSTTCDVVKTITEEYSCEKTEMKKFKKACGFGQGKTLVESPNDIVADVLHRNGLNSIRSGSGCVYESPVTVMGTCTRQVQVTQKEPCTEMRKEERCEVVQKEREVTCSRQLADCKDVTEEEVCQEVNSTVTKKGVRYEKRVETFPCSSTLARETCVELQVLGTDTCSANLTETKEVPCTRQRKKQVCQDESVDTMELCADIQEVEISFPCQEVVYEEKCSTVPLYELGTCEMTVVETVLEPCEKTFRVTECQPAESSQMGTCFNDVEVEVPQTCFKIEYETNCNMVQTTKLVKEALRSKAAGVMR